VVKLTSSLKEIGMRHTTKWNEVQHLVWRCDSCSKQCESVGCKPPDNNVCDGSDSRVKEITGGYSHPELLGGA